MGFNDVSCSHSQSTFLSRLRKVECRFPPFLNPLEFVPIWFVADFLICTLSLVSGWRWELLHTTTCPPPACPNTSQHTPAQTKGLVREGDPSPNVLRHVASELFCVLKVVLCSRRGHTWFIVLLSRDVSLLRSTCLYLFALFFLTTHPGAVVCF